MGTAGRTATWMRMPDVLGILRRRWERGEFLAQVATGSEFVPFGIPLRGPTARQIADDFAAAQSWARTWQASGNAHVRLEQASVGGRLIGTNLIPSKVWIDSRRQLWALLGVAREVRRFTDLLAAARSDAPRLVGWMTENPMKVLALEREWPQICDTVTWIDLNWRPRMYVRQVDVPGVDTKFIERNLGTLSELLDRQLDPHRIDPSRPRADFVGRYGFRGKPQYVRFRPFGKTANRFGAFSELTVRVDELSASAPTCSTIYVVENEVTYLAFPSVEDAIVIFGRGYALSTLRLLPWLADRNLVYWSDIDTHGFAMLDRLRGRFPHTRSMLMDRATLLAHEAQWVRESSSANVPLDRLTTEEAELYRDLVEDSLGPSVRLEQERIRFSSLLDAVSS